MEEQNELMKSVREAETSLNLKRLEAANLPARIEEAETRKQGLSDPDEIRKAITEIRSLQDEREVIDQVLRSHAVEVESRYAAFYQDRLRQDRIELDNARQDHQAAEAALKQAEKELELATTRLRKADHDVKEAERHIKTRQDNVSNLRSGQMAA